MIDNYNYSKKFDSIREKVNRELENYFKNKIMECDDDEIRNVVEELQEFTLNGGKRIRPVIMILGYNIFKDIDEDIVKASISIEMAQSFLLIHDDIMDESEMRRGKPSFHKYFELKTHNKKLSENIAISAGDLIDTFSHEALLESNFNREDLLKADYEFSRVIEDTGKGQILDIYSSIGENYEEEKLLKLHYLKTARYTIQGPLIIGSYLASNYDYTDSIMSYGKNMGIAFQLYDDILGIFGDENKTGKSSKSDVNEGKKTLLIIKAYNESDANGKKFIEKCIKSGNVNDSDFIKLKNIIRETGSYDYSISKIEEYTKKARDELKRVKGNQDALNMIDYLSNYLINREN